MIDTSFIIIAIIRTLLVVVVVYHFCKWFNANPPRNRFLKRSWKKDRKFRDFLIRYYWQIGVAFFVAQIIFGLVYNVFVD